MLRLFFFIEIISQNVALISHRAMRIYDILTVLVAGFIDQQALYGILV
jgi:hypothetical protein